MKERLKGSFQRLSVLVFGNCEETPDGRALRGKVTPLAYIMLANPIRKEAPQTFAYFEEQGVEVKVISGDNPVTVSEVAKKAGIAGADDFVDAATLTTEEEIRQAVYEEAPKNGFWYPAVSHAGQKLKKGTLLGTLKDIYGNEIFRCTAPFDGVVLITP